MERNTQAMLIACAIMALPTFVMSILFGWGIAIVIGIFCACAIAFGEGIRP
jgi:hypothetical protein